MRHHCGLAMLVVAVGCGTPDGRNHPPTMEPFSLVAREDSWKDFTITATDEDGDSIELTLGQASFVLLDGVSQQRTDDGTRLEADAQLWPRANYNGPYSFDVFLSDGTDRVTFEIQATIDAVDDEPVAVSDRIAGATNSASVIDPFTLLLNDSDADDTEEMRDELSIAGVDEAFAGTVALAAGRITFTPSTDFVGTGSFRYTVTDGEKTAQTTVFIDVGGPNAAPVPVADMVDTLEGEPFEIPVANLIGNDVDHDGHALAVIAVSNAAHGAVVLDHTTITFDPEDFFYGAAGFDYTVSDGVATAVGHVTVQVSPYI